MVKLLRLLVIGTLLAALPAAAASPPSAPYTSGVYVLAPANGDMSQATVTAVPTRGGTGDNRLKKNTLIVATWSGTSPSGTIQLYGSVDNITFVPLGNPVTVSGNIGATAWDVVGTGSLWLSVVYTKVSGTGTLTVSESSKGE